MKHEIAEKVPQQNRYQPQHDILPTIGEWKQFNQEELIEYCDYTEVKPVTNIVTNKMLIVFQFILVVSFNVAIGSIFVLILVIREMLSKLFMTLSVGNVGTPKRVVKKESTNVVTNVNVNVKSSDTNVTTNININSN